MPPDRLPQELGELLPGGGAGRVLEVDLPPGHLVRSPAVGAAGANGANGANGAAAVYWLSDEPVGPDLWIRLRQAHAQSGLWPVFAGTSGGGLPPPWASGDMEPQPVAEIDERDPGEVLRDLWQEWVDDPGAGEGLPELVPFGRDWPGLAPAARGGGDPDQYAEEFVRDHDDGTSPLILVPAARGADVVTAIGWAGPFNHTEDLASISAVLRSWEDRFGARLIELGTDVLFLTVSRPPAEASTERAAAEHFAFCPDNIVQGPYTISAYAAELRGENTWSFWWD